MRITPLRRIIQIISFILIVYAGFLGIQQIDIATLPFIEPGEGFTPEERVELLKAPQGYTQVFDTYLPPKTCRFIAGESRLFRACALHFFQESLTWLTPLKYLLPHILLFVILCFLLGRFWCGWICPLGSISDFLSIIRKKLKLAHIELPKVLNDGLVKFKYVFLSFIILISLAIAIPIASVLGITAFQKELFLPACQMCPARVLFPALGGEAPIMYSFDSLMNKLILCIAFVWPFLT